MLLPEIAAYCECGDGQDRLTPGPAGWSGPHLLAVARGRGDVS